MFDLQLLIFQLGSNRGSRRESRYLDVADPEVIRSKRCIECGRSGHFKCSTEGQSKRISLTFNVEDNLDEFLFSEIDNNICFQVETPPNEPNDQQHAGNESDYENTAPSSNRQPSTKR